MECRSDCRCLCKIYDGGLYQNRNLTATVFDAEIAAIVSFVTGNTELTPDTWKAFQDEMNSMGLSRIEEIQVEAYKNTYGE